MSENVLHTDYGWSGVRCPCWWLTGQAGPPPPLRDRPHPTDRGPRRRGAGLAVYCTVSGNVSECRDPVRDEKRPTFYMLHVYVPILRTASFKEFGLLVCLWHDVKLRKNGS